MSGADQFDVGVGGGSAKSPAEILKEMMAHPGFAMLVFLYGIAFAVKSFFGLNPGSGDWLLERYEHDVADSVAHDPGADAPERPNAG